MEKARKILDELPMPSNFVLDVKKERKESNIRNKLEMGQSRIES